MHNFRTAVPSINPLIAEPSDKNGKLKVIFMTPSRKKAHPAWFEALERSIPLVIEAGYDEGMTFQTGCPYISGARASMLKQGLNAKGDIFVFLDDDLSWDAEDIVTLLKTPGDVVGGEVPVALSEFLRVLKPGGHAIIFVPDLEGVKADESPLYYDPSGPVTGLDLIYGHRVAMRDNPYMAHHTGFVAVTLTQALLKAGFASAESSRQPLFNLLGVGIKA